LKSAVDLIGAAQEINKIIAARLTKSEINFMSLVL
jgi:hypothetical protein